MFQLSFECEGKGSKTIKAQQLWFDVFDSQVETGTPYMLYKDNCNSKSNQQNLGTIKCSNLCTEIVEYTDPDEVAVFNLASISLTKFVTPADNFGGEGHFDLDQLKIISKVVTKRRVSILSGQVRPKCEVATY